jgi:hypothetical protein
MEWYRQKKPEVLTEKPATNRLSCGTAQTPCQLVNSYQSTRHFIPENLNLHLDKLSRSGRKILGFLWNLGYQYLVQKSSAFVPILNQVNPAHILTIISLRSILILPSTLHPILVIDFVIQMFLFKEYMHFSSLSCMLHVLSISSFLMWSPE